MECNKKRTSNFSKDEKRILSELVLKYQKIIENKRTDATTNADKVKGWIRLEKEFNTISTYCYRSHVVLKCCWENIKRQAKKDRAETKKKIFMTGGGKPPSPPPSGESAMIVEAVLGPALEGNSNIYDSDAIINDISEFNNFPEKKEEQLLEEGAACSKENNENIVLENNPNDIIIEVIEENGSTSEQILKEQNVDNWSSWTPKNLKKPVSGALKVSSQEEDWLKRRRPKTECFSDILMKEKIQLVKILQENALKESNVRLAILEEQLKQEKIKTQKLSDN